MNNLAINKLAPSFGTDASRVTPTTPCSPISPVSPISPIILSHSPNFGLRQSLTNLAIESDANDIFETNGSPSTKSALSMVREKATNDDNNKNISLLPPISTTLNNNISSSSIFDTKDFLLRLSDIQDDCFLFENGYKKMRKIADTLQGKIYEGIIIDPCKRAKVGLERVAIKQIPKTLHKANEAIQDDDLMVIVSEDIVKEAIILKYLTKDNRPNGGYIARFIDFFEDDDEYYLITEYVGDCNLAQFVETAHEYIKGGKLKLSEYKKVIKFLFWQICVMVHWMHNDMKCVHLDLCLENIIVRDGKFEMDENDGRVSINPNIAVKLADFGLAEIYGPETTSFEAGKWGLKDSFTTTAPNVYNELIYDGKKADIWSLGCILYQISTGQSLYTLPDQDVDTAYYFLVNDKLGLHLETQRVQRYFNTKLLILMENMLNIDEEKRFSALQVLKCQWFAAYYGRYQSRIEKKSKSQKEQLKKQNHKMQYFPYYAM